MKSILLAIVILTGMYVALYPGEAVGYWANGNVMRITFEVVDNSWCHWVVVNQFAGFYDEGYMIHMEQRAETEIVPYLHCDLSPPVMLTVASPTKVEDHPTFVPEAWK